jgi:hypothetical protein
METARASRTSVWCMDRADMHDAGNAARSLLYLRAALVLGRLGDKTGGILEQTRELLIQPSCTGNKLLSLGQTLEELSGTPSLLGQQTFQLTSADHRLPEPVELLFGDAVGLLAAERRRGVGRWRLGH